MNNKTWEFVDRYEYTENALEDAFNNNTLQRFTSGEIKKIVSLVNIPEGGYADTYENIFDGLQIFNTHEFHELEKEKKVICFSENLELDRPGEYYCSINLAIFKDEDDYFLVIHHYELYNSRDSWYHDMKDVKCDQMRGLKDYFETEIFQKFQNMLYL